MIFCQFTRSQVPPDIWRRRVTLTFTEVVWCGSWTHLKESSICPGVYIRAHQWLDTSTLIVRGQRDAVLPSPRAGPVTLYAWILSHFVNIINGDLWLITLCHMETLLITILNTFRLCRREEIPVTLGTSFDEDANYGASKLTEVFEYEFHILSYILSYIILKKFIWRI